MESSKRDLFIDVIVVRFIFKNDKLMLSHLFHLTPKTGLNFYCV